jgi:para-nitrobenzyl esterase
MQWTFDPSDTAGTLVRRAVALGALVAAVALSTPALAHGGKKWHHKPVDRENGPVVRIDDGWLRGASEDGVHRFLGIPYAAPPVGELRWRPPAPAKPWHGIRDATEYASHCPQVTTLGVFAGPTSVEEDCLYLNVFTTQLGKHDHGKKRPVLVWIHGGGNIDGASNDYDGSKLATGGPLGTDTVVVIMNYRLGLFGFLAHPALNSEGHKWGNYGIMDIQAVLRWVQKNIEAFGGDPDNVTLGGQSAGASDTAANMISPYSKGLFHRAILQSSPTSTMPPASRALTRGTAFAEAAGCPGTDAAAAECLRDMTPQEILALQGTPNANGPYVNGPMVDGDLIPLTPVQAWWSGRFNRVPVLGGNTQDEATFGIGITQYFEGAPMTAEDYTRLVTGTYSGFAGPGGTPPTYPAGTVEQVLAQYPLSSYESPFHAYNRVGTDAGACRALRVERLLSKWVPVYAYQFNYREAPYYFPEMPGFDPLAAHTIDIQFLFPLWHGGHLGLAHELNPAESALSDKLVRAWTLFAKTGNPNGHGNHPWPRFTKRNQVLLSQNVPNLSTMTAEQYASYHKCDFWDTILVY